MSNLKRRLHALERSAPRSVWNGVLDAMPDDDLFRLEALVERLHPDLDSVWLKLSPEDRAFLLEVERMHPDGSIAATS